MNNLAELIDKVKEKKEFSRLDDSIIGKALEKSKGDVKEARAVLRKYFSVFLTNKIIKAKVLDEDILKRHISSKNRDYEKLYPRIIENEEAIIDLGAGVNGFSYNFMKDKKYLAYEATGQLVDLMNNYFQKNKFNANAIHRDLFDIHSVVNLVSKTSGKKIVFMFNIIDALEFFEKDYTKKLISEVSKNCEKIVLSWPTQSLSGRTKFLASRNWILEFIHEKFNVLDDFEMNGERFIIFRKL